MKQKEGFRLFLDDLKFPPAKGEWAIARSSREAIEMMEANGCPEFVSFDHDLGGPDQATAVVDWMVGKDLDAGGRWIPDGFGYAIHSENPIGARNIKGKLDGYLAHRAAERAQANVGATGSDAAQLCEKRPVRP